MTLITFQGFGHVLTVGHDNLNQRRMRKTKLPRRTCGLVRTQQLEYFGAAWRVPLAEALGVRLSPELIWKARFDNGIKRLHASSRSMRGGLSAGKVWNAAETKQTRLWLDPSPTERFCQNDNSWELNTQTLGWHRLAESGLSLAWLSCETKTNQL